MSTEHAKPYTGNSNGEPSHTRHVANCIHEQIEGMAEKGERLEHSIHERSSDLEAGARDLSAGVLR